MPNESLEAEKQLKSDVEQSIDYIEKFDILETINNVGNDEVFTPVKTCQKVLDILPDEVWHNPNYKWLNPCDKNGVFLREIAIRLDKGLKDAIPNDEERKKHIMQDMIYSIGLTRFTSLVSRRTVYYCSSANRHFDGSEDDSDHHSVNGFAIGDGTWFDTEEGNILTPITDHKFGMDGKCIYCGTSKGKNNEYGKYTDPDQLEHYAYEFIHITPKSQKSKLKLEQHLQNRFFGGNRNMKFDIIIGNPPYQLADGGAQASAGSIYNMFVDAARTLQPKYISFIIPSRWMSGGKGLDDFRESMLNDTHIKELQDYINPKDCFPSNDIKGGVCYFLWDKDYNGKCNITTHYVDGTVQSSHRYLKEEDVGTFIRDQILIDIYEKVKKLGGGSFAEIVSPLKPYGLRGDVFTQFRKYNLPEFKEKPFPNSVKVYGLINLKRIVRYMDKDDPHIDDKLNNMMSYKVFLPRANGTGAIGEVLSTPIIGTPMSICTETFLSIGKFKTEEEAKNCESYIKTKFFRTLLGIKKITQDNSRRVFELVPIQSFSKPWSDKELYEKYGLSKEEIDYIEEHIQEME